MCDNYQELNGARVPEVNIILQGFLSVISWKPREGLRHHKFKLIL